MPLLHQFAAPAGLTELSADGLQAWHERNAAIVAESAVGFGPAYYDPTAEDTPEDLAPVRIVWGAFPATIIALHGLGARRWNVADASRSQRNGLGHDEYCEWGVERNENGKVVRITFTTEVPEYWKHIAATDDRLLLALYRELAGPQVQLDDLFSGGEYLPRNGWNDVVGPDGSSVPARPIHLLHGSNQLDAAIKLAREATVLRHDADGEPVLDRHQLVRCSNLGEPLRNSDPQIAQVVNDAVAEGMEVTLKDPLGLYIDGLQSAGIVAPDGADAVDFWHIERGGAEHAVRASFAVPPEKPYVVGDLSIDGRPITRGGQVADKVRVRLDAFAKPGGTAPPREPCIGAG
jgi:hypothetical protein